MQVGNQSTQPVNVVPPRPKLGCSFILLPLGGLIMLGVAAWYGYSSYIFSTNGIEVQGTVVRLAEVSDADGTSYSPVFRYVVDGQVYDYESVNASDPPTHSVGDVQALLVDPDDPSRARQNSFWELWLLPCILGPIALVMLFFSLIIPLVFRR